MLLRCCKQETGYYSSRENRFLCHYPTDDLSVIFISVLFEKIGAESCESVIYFVCVGQVSRYSRVWIYVSPWTDNSYFVIYLCVFGKKHVLPDGTFLRGTACQNVLERLVGMAINILRQTNKIINLLPYYTI